MPGSWMLQLLAVACTCYYPPEHVPIVKLLVPRTEPCLSCGVCHLSAFGRSATEGYAYYVCRGKTDSLRASNNDRCQARYFPARQLDELVWSDLCAVLTEPEIMNHALERAKGGSCLPQELQSRQTTLKRSIKQLDQQQTRLMDAYLASVIELTELQRRRAELAQHQATLAAQQRQLDAVAKQHLDVAALADGIERFCSQVRAGLLDATFEERRALVELLIDRVIMTNGEVEIRYVIPTSPDGPHRRFCHLRLDYLDRPPAAGHPHERGQRRAIGVVAAVDLDVPRFLTAAPHQQQRWTLMSRGS